MKQFSVCYASDDGFAVQTGVSMLSLFENNKGLDISVYLLAGNISLDNMKRLKNIAEKYERTLEIISVEKLLREKISQEFHLPAYRDSYLTYARIFMPNLLPQNIDSVLYIDADTLVARSLDCLTNEDLSGYACAMVREAGFENLFYNAGVLFANLAYWRKHQVPSRLCEYLASHPGFDQDAINAVLASSLKPLALKYNQNPLVRILSPKSVNQLSGASIFPKQEIIEAKENPAIIHYWAFCLGRPWVKNCMDPTLPLWNHYFEMSPWAGNFTKKDWRPSFGEKISRFCYRILPEQVLVRKMLLGRKV